MCGGHLEIDVDRQVYFCPYCGVTFDYDYFRKDNALDLARKALKRNEFGAAKDAFDYMLTKDPHDFEALRGLILCKCEWTSMMPFLRDDKVFLQSDDPVLLNAIENCQPEYKDYFNLIRDALDVLHLYRKAKAEMASVSEDMNICRNFIIDREKDQTLNRTRIDRIWGAICGWLTDTGMFLGAIYLALMPTIVFCLFIFLLKLYWLPVVIAGVIALIAAIYKIKRAAIDREIEATKAPAREKLEVLNSKYDELSEETKKYIREYKQMAIKIVSTYKIADDE